MEITQNNFEAEVVQSDKPVLLDFWASWCGPCRMLSPIIVEIEKEYSGKIKVGKINVDEEGTLSAQFGIASIPTVVIIKDGKLADTSIGFMQKDALVKMLEKSL